MPGRGPAGRPGQGELPRLTGALRPPVGGEPAAAVESGRVAGCSSGGAGRAVTRIGLSVMGPRAPVHAAFSRPLA